MYEEIERSFKENSQYRKNQIQFSFIIFLYSFIIGFVSVNYLNKLKGWIILIEIGGIIILLLTLLLMVYIKLKKCGDLQIKDFKHPLIIFLKYKLYIDKVDISILKELLIKNGINTRPKVLEALRHYQILVPRKIAPSSQIISILALTISTLALIMNDKLYYSSQNINAVFIIIIMVLILYFVFRIINGEVLRLFGKNEFYKRLEASLSEIYMKCLIK